MCAWALWCEGGVGRRRVGVCERVCAHACARVRECVWMWSRLVPILILLFPRQRCGASKSAALGGVTDFVQTAATRPASWCTASSPRSTWSTAITARFRSSGSAPPSTSTSAGPAAALPNRPLTLCVCSAPLAAAPRHAEAGKHSLHWPQTLRTNLTALRIDAHLRSEHIANRRSWAPAGE